MNLTRKKEQAREQDRIRIERGEIARDQLQADNSVIPMELANDPEWRAKRLASAVASLITESDCVAEICYDQQIGSEFESNEGWHVNLMPKSVLREFPEDWKERAATKTYGKLTVIVPSMEDIMIPKRRRGEPRDWKHDAYAKELAKSLRQSHPAKKLPTQPERERPTNHTNDPTDP